MSARRLKASDVDFTEATFAPTAACRGILEHNPEKYGHDTREVVQECDWAFQPGQWGNPPAATVGRAKEHVRDHPGHEVVVEWLRRAVYWTEAPKEPIDEAGLEQTAQDALEGS